jgi:proline dehydrogenase
MLRWINKQVGRAYATEDVAEAMSMAQGLSLRGWAATLGYWDAGEDPALVHMRALRAIDAAARLRTKAPEVAVKLPALGSDWARLVELAAVAAEHNVRLHADALGPEHGDAAFACLERAACRGYLVGCTLPSRWNRSKARDVQRAIELGLPVRVVKGQWPEYVDDRQPKAADYLLVVDAVAGRVPRVGVATHDARLAASSLRTLRASGTAAAVELLIGLPVRRPLRVAKALAADVRIYIPFGSPHHHFGLSDLRADPRRTVWLLSRGLTPPEWWRPGGPLNGWRVASQCDEYDLRRNQKEGTPLRSYLGLSVVPGPDGHSGRRTGLN